MTGLKRITYKMRHDRVKIPYTIFLLNFDFFIYLSFFYFIFISLSECRGRQFKTTLKKRKIRKRTSENFFRNSKYSYFLWKVPLGPWRYLFECVLIFVRLVGRNLKKWTCFSWLQTLSLKSQAFPTHKWNRSR